MSPVLARPIRIQLDPRLGLPVYLQIVRQIRQQAAAGRLSAGMQLPTVRGLASQLGVNFNTVARAYRWLARSGSVSTQPGRGTFMLTAASGRAPGNAALHGLAAEYIAGARRLQFSDAQIAGALKLELRRHARALRAGDNHE